MQLGFVIDHTKCIGCHACTVACKAENDVPLGSFRTWVKYTEQGVFPEVRRSFAVLRCNQCTDAPCVEICPVRALSKRGDGIVDVDPAACIGCKACMQGCPYDALYLNPHSGTAEKCHFCAHRTEIGLAPACAVVCPTEAIIPGDFHDPESRVSRMRAEHDVVARKTEARTGPNVLYREVSQAGIDPLATSAHGGYLWANPTPGPGLDAERFLATLDEADRRARTTYDVDHPTHWGLMVSAYLFTKSLAAGMFLILATLYLPLRAAGSAGHRVLSGLGVGAIFFLLLTTLLLVADLKRPARFLYVITRPNWRSWLARGSLVLMAYGGLLTLWLLLLAVHPYPGAAFVEPWLVVAGCVLAALAAGYTGWLFGQARGRVLWMRRHLWLHLIVQAWIAGAAYSTIWLPALRELLEIPLLAALALHLAFILLEGRLVPAGREAEYARAHALLTRGPYAARHWGLGVGVGVVLPVVLLLTPGPGIAAPIAATLALIGLFTEEDVLVRAGQALTIS